MRTKRRFRTLVLPLLTGAVLVASAWVGVPYIRARRAVDRVEEYAQISLNSADRVISERDRWTWAFLDGEYSAVVKLGRKSLERLIANPPQWASSGWGKGRNTNLAAQMDIRDDGKLISATGTQGTTVCRILTIDLSEGKLYFELRSF